MFFSRLSTDPLELLFSCVRQTNVERSNPTIEKILLFIHRHATPGVSSNIIRNLKCNLDLSRTECKIMVRI